MKRHRDGNEAGGSKDAAGRDRPMNHAVRDRLFGDLDDDPLGCDRAVSPGDEVLPRRRWGTAASEWRPGGEDQEPVFSGSDEDLLYGVEDTDRLPGGRGGFREREGADRGLLIYPSEAAPLPFGDEEDALRWGNRRADECPLSFLGGDDATFCLGDGEDLP